MQNSLTNPIFWQGFAAAWAVFVPALVALLALTARMNDDARHTGRRGGAR